MTIEVESDADSVSVHVTDTGRGLEANECERIFEPFAQGEVSPALASLGSGLGLHVCKGIVTAHGGAISCASAGPGQGSRFTFTLPRDPPSPRTDDPAPEPAASSL